MKSEEFLMGYALFRSIIAFLALAGLPAFAKTPAIETLTIAGDDTMPNHDCSRRMAGHGRGAGQIQVCLEGRGRYSYPELTLLQSQDWFPAVRFRSVPIDQVHVVCAYDRHQIPAASRIVFPNRAEAIRGRAPRIELPCNLTAEETKTQLEAMQKLLLALLRDPNRVVASSNQVLAECGTFKGREACQMWKQYLGEIFSGDATRRLSGALVACDVLIDVGLDDPLPSPQMPPPPPRPVLLDGADPLAGIDLTAPIKPRNAEFDRVLLKFLNLTASCGSAADKVAECLDSYQKIRDYLAARGVSRGPRGSLLVRGVPVSPTAAEADDRLTVLARQEMYAEMTFKGGVLSQEPVAVAVPAVAAAPVPGTPAQWDQAFAESALSRKEYRLDINGPRFPATLDPCGLDLACLRRVNSIFEQFALQAPPADQLPSPCLRIESTRFTAPGKIEFKFGPAPAEDCNRDVAPAGP